MFLAPVCGSWTPLRASSWTLMSSLHPRTPPAALSCAINSLTPLAVGTPLAVSPPLIGSSVPIFTVPPTHHAPGVTAPPELAGAEPTGAELAPVPVLDAGGVVAVLPLQADRTSTATAPNAPSLPYFIKCSSSDHRPPFSANVPGRYPCPQTVSRRQPPHSPIVPWPRWASQGRRCGTEGGTASKATDDAQVAAGAMPYIRHWRVDCNTAVGCPLGGCSALRRPAPRGALTAGKRRAGRI
jgi:hypothetical protein